MILARLNKFWNQSPKKQLFTFSLLKNPNKNKTCRTFLEKRGQSPKWRYPKNSFTWTWLCWPNTKTLPTTAPCWAVFDRDKSREREREKERVGEIRATRVTYIYIYIYHHHVVPPAQISLTLSLLFYLSFIASGRSSGLYIWGSIGVHNLWARPWFSSSVLHVWFV